MKRWLNAMTPVSCSRQLAAPRARAFRSGDAGGLDHGADRGMESRSHHVRAGHTRGLRELLQELDADSLAFGFRVGCALEPLDESVRDHRSEELLFHPARRAR